MATSIDHVFSQMKGKGKGSIYSDPRNIITLALWAAILGTHGFLVFILGKELYHDIRKRA